MTTLATADFLRGPPRVNVNSDLVAAWFDTLKGPDQHLVWFEHSGHMPMIEEPGKFLISLVRYARPIAERAGDAPNGKP